MVRKEGDLWSLDHHGPSGAWCATYSIPPEGSFLGRSSDIVLDANAPQLSRRHAQVVPETDGLRAYDRGAHNGSFLRVPPSESIKIEAHDENNPLIGGQDDYARQMNRGVEFTPARD